MTAKELALETHASGLTSTEAAARLARVGPNQLKARRQSALLQFLARFRNPLVLILLAASAISAATGDATSATVVAVMVLLSVILDFVQEHRAGQAAEKLASTVALTVQVLRDGAPQERPPPSWCRVTWYCCRPAT